MNWIVSVVLVLVSSAKVLVTMRVIAHKVGVEVEVEAVVRRRRHRRRRLRRQKSSRWRAPPSRLHDISDGRSIHDQRWITMYNIQLHGHKSR